MIHHLFVESIKQLTSKPFSKSTPNLDSWSMLGYSKPYTAGLAPSVATSSLFPLSQKGGLSVISDQFGGAALSEEDIVLDEDDESMETCSSGTSGISKIHYCRHQLYQQNIALLIPVVRSNMHEIAGL